ncbi:hypothetical protein NLJ89_g1760 [Agrocybe chaxingu]|uniref:Uncharacterized protein n=1 Tax=Agrocybe chaxingu TaxID=84603 RepID=A0A9W8TDT3_9AGAR|nr:hypothetical protein NLJ89_g1760 [Agrocybe chaxingu]
MSSTDNVSRSDLEDAVRDSINASPGIKALLSKSDIKSGNGSDNEYESEDESESESEGEQHDQAIPKATDKENQTIEYKLAKMLQTTAELEHEAAKMRLETTKLEQSPTALELERLKLETARTELELQKLRLKTSETNLETEMTRERTNRTQLEITNLLQGWYVAAFYAVHAVRGMRATQPEVQRKR